MLIQGICKNCWKLRYVPDIIQGNTKSGLRNITSQSSTSSRFVPKFQPVENAQIKMLQNFTDHYSKLVVITGAGLSTESGIPDYRSEDVGLYARSKDRPIRHFEFINNAAKRQRYWARNFVGWPVFRSFEPNRSHHALAKWEAAGKIHWLITQNVDALHTKAGSSKVTELHGCSHRVECLQCKEVISRDFLQARMIEMNPEFKIQSVDIAPDGDVLLTQMQVMGFKVPDCSKCGGILKPQVVFFGDNVARPVVEFLYQRVEESDAILVAGSSLQVFSSFKFLVAAHEQKKPIAIINIGPTRADKQVTLKIDAKLGDIIPSIKV